MKKILIFMILYVLMSNSCSLKEKEINVQEIEKLLNFYQKINKFNGTALIAKGDTVVYEKGFGFQNFNLQKLNTANSIFQIYSITKTFTSTLIFKLIEQKKLSLDDKLNRFFPDFINGDKITIEHLLQHTSGLNDQLPINSPETESYRIANFSKNEPHFQVGTGWEYCNGGYIILGYIIEKITGKSYESNVRELIFNPLEMTNSGFDYKNLNDSNKTIGYTIFNKSTKKAKLIEDSTRAFSAGAIYSTVGDLFKFHRAVQNQKILTKQSFDKAIQAGSFNKNYGSGWTLQDINGNNSIGHTGGYLGNRSGYFYFPEKNIAIIIFNNNENANVDFLAEKIISTIENGSFEVPKERILTEKQLLKATGVFSIDDENPTTLFTTIIDGRLAVKVGEQSTVTLLSEKENEFSQEEAHAKIEFYDELDGNFQNLVINQGIFRKLKAKRIKPSWGIIGTATSKGWNSLIKDIEMRETTKNIWEIKNVNLKKGEIKFRFCNSWDNHLGDNFQDKLLDIQGENIKIEGGIYNIKLDIRDENKKLLTLGFK